MRLIPLADAHVHEKDGDISALIHITPDDRPVESEDAIIHFGIQENEKNIIVENCDCEVILKKEGKEVQRYELTEGLGEEALLYNANVPLKFPTSGAYEIILTGNYQGTDSAKPFTLNFATRVENGKPGTQPAIFYIACCVLAVSLIIVVLVLLLGRKK